MIIDDFFDNLNLFSFFRHMNNIVLSIQKFEQRFP